MFDLQKAVYSALAADTTLMAIVTGVYEGIGTDDAVFPFVSLDMSYEGDKGTKSTDGRELTVDVHIWTEGAEVLDNIRKRLVAVLHHANLSLASGTLVSIYRTSGRVQMEPDGRTRHGIYSFTALIDE